jgi:hypothetical protein
LFRLKNLRHLLFEQLKTSREIGRARLPTKRRVDKAHLLFQLSDPALQLGWVLPLPVRQNLQKKPS